MLIPIGQEDDSVRRVPWVTISIIALCIVMHLYITDTVSTFEEKAEEVVMKYFEYYFAHPYLEMDEELMKQFQIGETELEVLKSQSQDKYSELPDEDVIAEEQENLDRMAQELKYAIKGMPYFQYGFVPAHKSIFGLIMYMFVHGGWMHLLFNLLYLYVMGPFVEDAWGKPLYTAFYLITGIIAALGFAMHYPNFAGPLIGASGAISGVMGGFVVRFWHARIRYFYMFSIIVRGTFSAPAWLMLPIGFAMDFLSASLMDSAMPEGGGGVAHWAHVWGFIAGVGLAFLIKYFKIEEKYVAPKIHAQTTYVNKSYESYEAAMNLLSNGEKEPAWEMLADIIRKDASNQDAVEALWNLAPELGKQNEAAPCLARLIEKEAQQNRPELALLHFRYLRGKFPDARISTFAKIMLFEQSVNVKDREESKGLYNEVIKEVNPTSPPGFLLNLSAAVLKYDLTFDESVANRVLEFALNHPDIPQERKDSLKEKLYAVKEQKAKGVIKVDGGTASTGIEQNWTAGSAGGAGAFVAAGAFAASAIPVTGYSTSSDLPLIPIPSTAKKPDSPGPAAQMRPFEDDLPPIANPYQKPKPAPPSFDQPPPIPAEPKIYIPIELQEPVPEIPPRRAFDQPPPIPIEPRSPLIPPPPAPPPPPQKPPAPKLVLRITKAVPLGVKERKIALNIEGMGQRLFPLEKIKGMSVVKIAPPGERPYLLIDLLVDELNRLKGELRLIRLSSTNFNPQKFVPSAPGPLDAFKVFTSGLLKMTGGFPFPNLESVELKKVTTFPSVQDYENTLLKAGSS